MKVKATGIVMKEKVSMTETEVRRSMHGSEGIFPRLWVLFMYTSRSLASSRCLVSFSQRY